MTALAARVLDRINFANPTTNQINARAANAYSARNISARPVQESAGRAIPNAKAIQTSTTRPDNTAPTRIILGPFSAA